MVKKKKREWSYLGMLAASTLLFLVCWKMGWITLDAPASGTEAHFRDDFLEWEGSEWLNEPVEPEKEGTQSDAGVVGEVPVGPTQAVPVDPTQKVPADEGVDEEETVEPKKPFAADVTYFHDALFIGDSRTVGLSEYGDLGQAEVLADSGMSVYKVMKTEFPTRQGGKTTLPKLLEEREFGKIYIMLGINELGYDFDQTVKRYSEMVEIIRSLQPQALIFLEANLHITGEKSETSPYYNNENIDRFNNAVAQLADGETVFYIDVNELFDDEEGNLSPEYTSDHTHILGKYYAPWVEWLLSKAVPVQ